MRYPTTTASVATPPNDAIPTTLEGCGSAIAMSVATIPETSADAVATPTPSSIDAPDDTEGTSTGSSHQIYNRLPVRYPSSARTGESEAAPEDERLRRRRSHSGQLRRGPIDGARPGRARP